MRKIIKERGKNVMRYQEAEIEIIEFDAEDVITTSCTPDLCVDDDCVTDGF